MPLYEYECEACGHRFEQIQSFSDPPVEKCPVCGGSVRKLLSTPAIQFKGSGWYITDYARKGQNADKGDKSTDKGPDKKDKNDKSDKSAESGAKSAGSTDSGKSSPASDSPSSSGPATPSTGSSSSDS
jgi:putative FmdB family regulatory protein